MLAAHSVSWPCDIRSTTIVVSGYPAFHAVATVVRGQDVTILHSEYLAWPYDVQLAPIVPTRNCVRCHHRRPHAELDMVRLGWKNYCTACWDTLEARCKRRNGRLPSGSEAYCPACGQIIQDHERAPRQSGGRGCNRCVSCYRAAARERMRRLRGLALLPINAFRHTDVPRIQPNPKGQTTMDPTMTIAPVTDLVREWQQQGAQFRERIKAERQDLLRRLDALDAALECLTFAVEGSEPAAPVEKQEASQKPNGAAPQTKDVPWAVERLVADHLQTLGPQVSSRKLVQDIQSIAPTLDAKEIRNCLCTFVQQRAVKTTGQRGGMKYTWVG